MTLQMSKVHIAYGMQQWQQLLCMLHAAAFLYRLHLSLIFYTQRIENVTAAVTRSEPCKARGGSIEGLKWAIGA